MLKLVSLNIALPTMVQLNGTAKKFRTGIFKKPINEKIFLDESGFHGDGVGDTRIHGGKDLAVCAYFVDHFTFWNNELDRVLEPGAFGENLSLAGIDETQINVGDIFCLGEAEIEVSQPRQPCHKLNKIFKYQGMACKVQTTGFTGCYFRVKRKGWVEPGATIEKIKDGLGKFSIDKINSLMFKEKKKFDLLRKVVRQEALSLEWREKFEKRL
ncbi:MAG: MOSC domain-containing protein [Nitrospina sp.]|jgi:MOSC domain-containing protein YiiM|nr:MOSC domain-containing protein [Nitrospina sp.]